MMGLDAWLEAPYVDAARREADFERWVEANEPELDLDDQEAFDAAWERYEDFLEDQGE